MIVYLLLLITAKGLDNGQGKTPPMGWNSWNHFGCNVTEQLVMDTMEGLMRTRLADAGYTYVILGDCWQLIRNFSTKEMIPDRKIPNYIPHLMAYAHSKGLKLGLYSVAGNQTCAGRPGGLGLEQVDANTYAKWKIDYLLYDSCTNSQQPLLDSYAKMREALIRTNHPIYYSIGKWKDQQSYEPAQKIANSWKTSNYVQDNWQSFTRALDQQVGLEEYAKPGAWNDPGVLHVGKSNLNIFEQQARLVLWAVLKAPLIISCDVNTITKQLVKVLSNQQVIDINQDQLGEQAKRIKRQITPYGFKSYYAGRLSNNRHVLVLLNSQNITGEFLLQNQLLPRSPPFKMRDILTHQNIGTLTNQQLFISGVHKHSVKAYVLS